jgi:hypothetical protein
VGNLAVAQFLNAVVASSRAPHRLQPSTPNVMVDELATILRLAVMPMMAWGADLVIVETVLRNVDANVEIRFWVLPDLAARGGGARTTGRRRIGASVFGSA